MNSSNLAYRNIRFITESESWKLLVYQVDTKLISVNKSRLKLLANSRRVSVYTE